MCAAPNTAVFL